MELWRLLRFEVTIENGDAGRGRSLLSFRALVLGPDEGGKFVVVVCEQWGLQEPLRPTTLFQQLLQNLNRTACLGTQIHKGIWTLWRGILRGELYCTILLFLFSPSSVCPLTKRILWMLSY